jgi:hypothetical protein
MVKASANVSSMKTPLIFMLPGCHSERSEESLLG